MPNGLHKAVYLSNLDQPTLYILICFICSVMNKKRYNQSKVFKRYIKFLSIAPDTEVVGIVLQKALDGVILAICNAALNAREGDVRIPPYLKHIFAKYHRHIHRLTDRSCPLIEKRPLLVQRGGVLLIIAPLIATVLGSIGGKFIFRLFHKNE